MIFWSSAVCFVEKRHTWTKVIWGRMVVSQGSVHPRPRPADTVRYPVPNAPHASTVHSPCCWLHTRTCIYALSCVYDVTHTSTPFFSCTDELRGAAVGGPARHVGAGGGGGPPAGHHHRARALLPARAGRARRALSHHHGSAGGNRVYVCTVCVCVSYSPVEPAWCI